MRNWVRIRIFRSVIPSHVTKKKTRMGGPDRRVRFGYTGDLVERYELSHGNYVEIHFIEISGC